MKILRFWLLPLLVVSCVVSNSAAQLEPVTRDKPEAVAKDKPKEGLSKFEKSVLGKWYFAGDVNRVAYFVNSGPVLLFINEEKNACEMSEVKEGVMLGTRPDYQCSFLFAGEHMMTSNGFWWSRHPVKWGVQKSDAKLDAIRSSSR